MSAITNVLDALANDEKEDVRINHNGDRDFGLVLEFCSENVTHTHKFRYSNGEEENFSFEN